MVVRKPHVVLERTASPDPASMAIEIREFIQEIHADLKDLNVFYSMSEITFVYNADVPTKMSASLPLEFSDLKNISGNAAMSSNIASAITLIA